MLKLYVSCNSSQPSTPHSPFPGSVLVLAEKPAVGQGNFITVLSYPPSIFSSKTHSAGSFKVEKREGQQ